ncbi:MarR family winged helix-turn-helix transcriptional regulator [Agromyces sp. NPDC058484]|uniref:MarR family winged helix-turn-helix transcriptional regulator n=1 Tax=Agromyces sp. NPDC058484 TaxID=3346524 RepID=UPI0036602B0D
MQDREARLVESRRLSRMFFLVAERSKADFAAAVAPFGLPVPIARAILMLGEPRPMRELADRLACDPSYVTNIADTLEERGLAQRSPGEDRRVKLLRLTDEGAELRDRIADAVAEGATVSKRLTDAERAALAPLLERLLAPGD